MKKVWSICVVALVVLVVAIIGFNYFSNKDASKSPSIEKEYDVTKLATLFDDGARIENFRHMDTILPNNVIENSKKPYKFKRNLQDKFDGFKYQFNENEQSLTDLLNKTETTGLLVVKDDTIVYEKYFDGNDQWARNTSWSMAKSFLSALIGIAIDEGKIKSVDDKIINYLPELKDSGYTDVTIKDVLTMSSGVAFNEDYADPESDINMLTPRLFFEGESINKIVAETGQASEPGTFLYKSIDTQVLSMLITKATGVPVSKYLEEKIWKPLGMESSAYWNTDLQGNEIGFAFLNATLQDYAKFGKLYAQNGRWLDRQIVPEPWVKESTTINRPDLAPGVADPDFGYGYQWWIPQDANDKEFMAIGIWGQYIYVNQNKDLVIVKTSTDPAIYANDGEVIEAFRQLANQIK